MTAARDPEAPLLGWSLFALAEFRIPDADNCHMEPKMREGRPVPRLRTLTFIGLVAMAVATLWKIVWLGGLYIPAAWISGIVQAGLAALVMSSRAWWALSLAAVAAALMVVGALSSPVVMAMLQNPTDVARFVSTILQLAGGTVAAVAGVWSGVQLRKAMSEARH
jgi:hypothetical protein